MTTFLRSIPFALTIYGIAGAQDTVRIKTGAPAWGPNISLTKIYEIGGPPAE